MKHLSNGVYFGESAAETGEIEGRGVIFYHTGKIFEGHFRNGLRSGLGYEEYPDHSFYLGNF